MTKKLAAIIDIVFYSVLIVLAYLIIKYLFVYILPFLVSLLSVYLLQKPSIKISKKVKISKNLITLILLISLVLISIITILILSSKVFVWLFNIFNNSNKISSIYEHFKNVIDANKIELNLPDNAKNFVFENINNLSSEFLKWGSELLISAATKFIKVLPGFILSVIISVVCACYLAFDYDNFIVFIKKQLSESAIERTRKLKELINNCFIKMMLGYLTIFIITFLELLFGFWVLNLENSLIMALLIAFVDILPIFGTGIILIPFGIFQIIASNYILGIGLIILYIIITIVRYFLEPKIIGNRVGLNPIISLVFMFLGLRLFGIFGLILLPLLVSIISLLNKEGVITLYK